jgi:hypothetical protein
LAGSASNVSRLHCIFEGGRDRGAGKADDADEGDDGNLPAHESHWMIQAPMVCQAEPGQRDDRQREQHPASQGSYDTGRLVRNRGRRNLTVEDLPCHGEDAAPERAHQNQRGNRP